MKEKTFYILSCDRHRDDIVYLFKGTFEDAKKKALVLLRRMRKYDIEEIEGGGDGDTFLWAGKMCDGDYSVTVGIPSLLK